MRVFGGALPRRFPLTDTPTTTAFMARKTRPWDSPEVRPLLLGLMALYDQVEQRYAAYSCPGSTECCRFGITGRQPYVTSLEVLALIRAVAQRGGGLSPKRRALPLMRTQNEEICPLLDRSGRCSVYSARPFGCRSFWCPRASHTDVAVDRTTRTQWLRRLQRLAAQHRPDGDRGRPLLRVLAELRLD